MSILRDKDLKKEVTMAFYKKQQLKSNGKWYPHSITVGKPVDTDKIAQRLAEISTVSPADTYAVQGVRRCAGRLYGTGTHG